MRRRAAAARLASWRSSGDALLEVSTTKNTAYEACDHVVDVAVRLFGGAPPAIMQLLITP